MLGLFQGDVRMDIPNPEDTGSIGSQVSSSSDVSIIPECYVGTTIPERIEGLVAQYPHRLGGEIGAQLIAGCYTQMSKELNKCQENINTLNRINSEGKEEISNLKISNAQLNERISANGRNRIIENLSITIGMALLGIAIELYKNKLNQLSCIITIMGIVLSFVGWLSGIRGSNS